MLILRLNENKTLTLNKTSSNFTGENNFEKIRIVADNTVGDKQLQDLITELYIYNIIDEDWSTFNDCVSVEWTEENDKLIFEVPVKGQYTIFPKLGMYLRFSDGNSLIGKTNIVKTMILHHKDNTIDCSNSIGVFENYQRNSIKLFEEQKKKLLSIKASPEPETRVYFKKNCENWTTPRVYLFNNEYGDRVPNLYNSYTPWQWNESPYMIQDESDENLYYIDLPLAKYKYIIFFCDERAWGAFNYKTNDLVIPSSVQYPSLCYWQSPIGFDGIWIDKNKDTFPLYLQSNVSNCSVAVDGNVLTGQSLGSIGIALTESTASQYMKFEIPLNAEKIQIAITEYAGSTGQPHTETKEYCIYELCYNVPVIYLNQWEVETLSIEIFDGTTDSEFLFETRYSHREYELYRDIYKNFGVLNTYIEKGEIRGYLKAYYSGSTLTNSFISAKYVRIEDICLITGTLSFEKGTFQLGDGIEFKLPFVADERTSSGILTGYTYSSTYHPLRTDLYLDVSADSAWLKSETEDSNSFEVGIYAWDYYFSLAYIIQK